MEIAEKQPKWTQGKLNSFIKSALRSASQRYPPKYEALNKAFVGKQVNSKTGRIGKHYICNACKGIFPASEVQVDHLETVVPLDGFVTWDDVIERMFCGVEGLQILCKQCHLIKTKKEKEIREKMKDELYRSTYNCWRDMKQRCYNEKSQRFKTHGARGIKVCESWRNSFEEFLRDMGVKPQKNLSLDRINNDGNYEKGNCRWATSKEQANNRGNCIYVEFNGEVLTVQQWADKLGFSHISIIKRLSKFPIEIALSNQRFESQKISDELKEEILNRHINGESQRSLSKEYGVSQAAISKWKINGKQ